MRERSRPELDAIKTVLGILSDLDESTRSRVLRTITAFFSEEQHGGHSEDLPKALSSSEEFFLERAPSPKEFMTSKAVRNLPQRVALLGYYLQHFRNRKSFKPADIGKLNSEAELPRISNIADSVMAATKAGYLVSADRGEKRVSTRGEQFVLRLIGDSEESQQLALGNSRSQR